MNLSEKRFSLKRASSRHQISVGLCGRSAVLAVAIMGWCVAIRGAEIHEAAELGDLEKVKAYLSQDPKQIDLVDAKGRTVLDRAARSGKQDVVEFLLAKGATEDIYTATIVGHVDKVAAFLKQDKKLVNARDSGGKAPLHWAALYGQKKVMELLLAYAFALGDNIQQERRRRIAAGQKGRHEHQGPKVWVDAAAAGGDPWPHGSGRSSVEWRRGP